MQNDTRNKNVCYPLDSIYEYLQGYALELKSALYKLNPDSLNLASGALSTARGLNKRIFVAGNGGSAAIADHLECDFVKGTCIKGLPSIPIVSLTSNVPLLTAIANDISYQDVFKHQLELRGASKGEILILISSSGKSPNIIEALKWAKNNQLVTIGLTGFDGGPLRVHADISIHIDVHNYGVVEDCHQAVMHILAQFNYLSTLESKRWPSPTEP